ncbi:uncharacterized protein EV420DRAFT_1717390 [Desarmillaria tabescens]|uniref:Glycoside hydrolase family 76 protein n=1 Tax=Armillaria tabescens TaxID=1929756 RepID=A0AA39JPK6_ARMTA|nr:uncharacterized protein EV420DRAFT_1717390 [Desarmillaria tabescens]KAK0445650.1 hypothetical protein EV420DRAFT_1717390 [Desarmillaria tabescens]
MRSLLLVWMLVAPLIASVAAQDLTPSTSWKNPNITLSKDDRISIASAAIEKAASMLQNNGLFNDSTQGTAGRLYAQMAGLDRLTNQTMYKQTLKQAFVLAESLYSEFSNTIVSSLNYGLNYGYAAARAYTAYQDPDFLDIAVTSWTSARRYTISKEQAASGSTDVKNFNLSTSCEGATMAGGTFYSINSSDTALSSLASGSFLVVSALLAEATSNQTYLDAAIESANFIQSHLLDPSNIVVNSISSKSNDSCSVSPTLFSYNSGIFTEGLAVLVDITRNASTEALLRSTITTIARWQGIDGVITIPTDGGRYIVRALAALYERNTTYSDLREYIKEYIGVQYNAVIEHATSGGTNIYGSSWTGPPSTSFSSDNQTVAISALLSAIPLADDQASSKPSDTPTSTAPLSTKKSPTGVIVGGVIGGLAVAAAMISGVLLLRRRHRQWNNNPLNVNGHSPQILTPFTATSVEHHMTLAESTTPPRAATSPPNPLPTETQRREDTRVEELLRLLHERLQPGRWNVSEDELPPEYHEGQTM